MVRVLLTHTQPLFKFHCFPVGRFLVLVLLFWVSICRSCLSHINVGKHITRLKYHHKGAPCSPFSSFLMLTVPCMMVWIGSVPIDPSCISILCAMLLALFGEGIHFRTCTLCRRKHVTGCGIWEVIALSHFQFSLLASCVTKCDQPAFCSSFYVCLPHHYEPSSGTVSELNSFFHKLLLVTTFYHINRRVTRTRIDGLLLSSPSITWDLAIRGRIQAVHFV